MGCRPAPGTKKLWCSDWRERGVTTFLPLVTEVHRWSDRKKSVRDAAVQLLCVREICAEPGGAPAGSPRGRSISGWSALGGEGAPIPDEQIDAVRSLVDGQLPWSSHPFLKIGQRVRIRSGALDGWRAYWSRATETAPWSSPWMRSSDPWRFAWKDTKSKQSDGCSRIDNRFLPR